MVKPNPVQSNSFKADFIKRQVGLYFKKKRRAIFVELGLNKGGRLRVDVLALSMRGEIAIVEVKSSVRDFRTDSKWQHYLPYCNQFYFAMPSAVYEKIKILPHVGVFLVDDKIVKVLPARKKEVDPAIATQLFIRAAFRNSDLSNRKNRDTPCSLKTK